MARTDCHVCAQIGEGWHFGAFVCRPCASFFRRSMAERKSYTCRKGGECPVNKNTRNSCRACRMQKCAAVGMRAPTSSTAGKQDVASVSAPSAPAYVPTPSTAAAGESHLAALCDCLRNYSNARLSYYVYEHPNCDVTNITQRLVNRETHSRLERMSLTMMRIHILDACPFLRKFERNVINELQKTFSLSFLMLTKAYFTKVYFAHDKGRVFAHVGYFVDIANIDYILGPEADKVRNFMTESVHELRRISEKCVRIEMTEQDLAFLFGVQLSNCLNKIIPGSTEVDEWRSSLFSEFHELLVSKYGNQAAILRYSEMLLFLNDTDNAGQKVKEAVLIFLVFGNPLDADDLSEIYDVPKSASPSSAPTSTCCLTP